MGLFSKEKKLTLDDIIKGIEGLSPEEKEELVNRINGSDEEEVEATEEATEEAEEVEAEEENTGAADDETAETDVTEPEETEEVTEEEAVAEEPEALDESEQENVSVMIRAFGDRLTALEKSFGEFAELKAAMDEFTNKQKEAFGYKSNAGAGSHKDFADMSAAELKAHILNK